MASTNIWFVGLCMLAWTCSPADCSPEARAKCPTGRRGIKKCKETGFFQSCNGCGVYVRCVGTTMYDNLPCAANLVWDDDIKTCVRSSGTCTFEEEITTTEAFNPGPCGTGPRGIKNCRGLPSGSYQSCEGCRMYARCVDSVLVALMPCSANLVWDDNAKTCAQTSTTCGRIDTTTPFTTEAPCATGSRGISSCAGLAAGPYQSCIDCSTYIVCTGGTNVIRNSCPAGLVWDDNTKTCGYSSATCSGSVGPSTVAPECQTGPRGIQSCDGLAPGYYQSCKGCDVYATCIGGTLVDDRPCPAGQVWGDNRKRCDVTSNTCPMVVSTTTAEPDSTTTTEPAESTMMPMASSTTTKNENEIGLVCPVQTATLRLTFTPSSS